MYQLHTHIHQVQEASNRAAARFDKANSQHAAAKEMINVAEEQLGDRIGDPSSPSALDLAWQEMLNHATGRVSWGGGADFDKPGLRYCHQHWHKSSATDVHRANFYSCTVEVCVTIHYRSKMSFQTHVNVH